MSQQKLQSPDPALTPFWLRTTGGFPLTKQ